MFCIEKSTASQKGSAYPNVIVMYQSSAWITRCRPLPLTWKYTVKGGGAITICSEKVANHMAPCPKYPDNTVAVLLFVRGVKQLILLTKDFPKDPKDLGLTVTSVQKGFYWDEYTGMGDDIATKYGLKDVTIYRYKGAPKERNRAFVFAHKPDPPTGTDDDVDADHTEEWEWP